MPISQPLASVAALVLAATALAMAVLATVEPSCGPGHLGRSVVATVRLDGPECGR